MAASIDFTEEEIKSATENFDRKCELGSGAFGSIYRGRLNNGTDVAIKWLKLPDTSELDDEVEILSAFRHPNLALVMGFCRHVTDDSCCLVYEFLPGGCILQRLHKCREGHQRFDAMTRVAVAIDAATGLCHMVDSHPRTFHRDIKCQNILLDKDGRAKLADFGLACVSLCTFQLVGKPAGTPGYACPEYFKTGLVTESTEVYSFGMVLLEMLTGIPPAFIVPGRQQEMDYIMSRLIDPSIKDNVAQSTEFLRRIAAKVDPTAYFPDNGLASAMGELIFKSNGVVPLDRPRFTQVLELLQNSQSNPAEATRKMSTMRVQRKSVMISSDFFGPSASGVTENQRKSLSVGSTGSPFGNSLTVPSGAQSPLAVMPSIGETSTLTTGAYSMDPPLLSGGMPLAPPTSPATSLSVPPPVGGAERNFNLPAGERASSVRFESCDQDGNRVLPKGHRPSAVIGPVGARLVCVFAESLNIDTVPEQSRVFPLSLTELKVGRGGDLAKAWETLVPDAAHRSRISREHFKVYWRDDASVEKGFVLICLSANGMIYNDRFIAQNAERLLRHGDQISLETIESGSHPVRFLTFRFDHIDMGSAGREESEGLAWVYCPAYSHDRTIPVPTVDGEEVIIGRAGRYAGVWEQWLPDESARSMVSREHFKISVRKSKAGMDFYLSCLSANGMSVNGSFLQGGVRHEMRLMHNDNIELLTAIHQSTSTDRKPILELRFFRQEG
jgi:serine/threonine protein kinase